MTHPANARDTVFSPVPGWQHGVFLARVTSLDDPEQRHRVAVRLLAFDAAAQQDAELWARVVAPFAGDDRGAYFLPEVGDEVLLTFVQGDVRQPLLVGGLWNGATTAPASIEPGGVNRYKRLRSRNGVTVTLDDQNGQEALRLETPGGQRLTLQDGPGSVTIEDANGNRVTLDTSGVSVEAAATVRVQATRVEVSAGMVTVDAAMAQFSGMVRCETLQTNAVISSSYTPGAGNVW